MKVRYVGESFYTSGLTDGVVYECLGVEECALYESGIALRIIDDEGWPYWEVAEGELPGYLYSALNPAPPDGSGIGGSWEIVEDDEAGTLRNLLAKGEIIDAML